MVNYLIICRSLTYAQRTASVLERAGVGAHVLRAPRSIDGEGCSHAVRVSERNLSLALTLLAREGLSPRRVYIVSADGTYNEVFL